MDSKYIVLLQKIQLMLPFEASVAGGIPIIRAMQESFVSDTVTGFSGISKRNFELYFKPDDG